MFEFGNLPSIFGNETVKHTKKLEMKITVKRSTNKVLCAVAGNDFIDFLLNFLTIPIGSIDDAQRGSYGLQSIDNLYKSVESLDPKWFNSYQNLHRPEENFKMILLKPAIFSNHKSKNFLLHIKEGCEPYLTHVVTFCSTFILLCTHLTSLASKLSS
ncbi:hypothetical protein FXO38_20206 [Capsicum annuum]|nr:hypothetical protein FXO38_20206 [Capsicum annuum]KAF3681541.1 hypothetical protein FXO37_02857 [Capsicum annuum]